MLRTDDNPDGLPIEVFDGIRAGEAADRSQLYRDLADGPFFGHNRNHDVSQGFRDAFWLQSMACGHRAAYECIAAFSRHRLPARPGEGRRADPGHPRRRRPDRAVRGRRRSAPPSMVAGAVLKVYEGSGHALPDTARDRLHADLLAFIDS